MKKSMVALAIAAGFATNTMMRFTNAARGIKSATFDTELRTSLKGKTPRRGNSGVASAKRRKHKQRGKRK